MFNKISVVLLSAFVMLCTSCGPQDGSGPADYTATLDLLRAAALKQTTVTSAEIVPVDQVEIIFSDGEKGYLRPDNLHREVSEYSDEAERIRAADRFVQRAIASITAESVAFDPKAVFPVLRELGYGTDVPDPDGLPLIAPFSRTLRVHFVRDLGSTRRLVARNDPPKLDLSHDEFLRIADSNLTVLAKAANVKRGLVNKIALDDRIHAFASSLLLLNAFWLREAETMPGGIVAGIPTWQDLYFVDSAAPNAVTALREIVDAKYRTGYGPITNALFRWTGSGWEELD